MQRHGQHEYDEPTVSPFTELQLWLHQILHDEHERNVLHRILKTQERIVADIAELTSKVQALVAGVERIDADFQALKDTLSGTHLSAEDQAAVDADVAALDASLASIDTADPAAEPAPSPAPEPAPEQLNP